MTGTIIAGVIILLVIIIYFSIYNSLVAVRNHCDEAWANIDTELKRRHDLIPNLVATVKGYASHEREVLTKVTELREACIKTPDATAQHAQMEGKLASALQSLMVRLEAYPELKANRNFLDLQKELTNTEDRIQAALRFYNGNVRENNTKVEMFPSNMVAGISGFAKREYFEIQGQDFRETPKIAF
jgi:LemA protein